jgi:hypothetical protein
MSERLYDFSAHHKVSNLSIYRLHNIVLSSVLGRLSDATDYDHDAPQYPEASRAVYQ